MKEKRWKEYLQILEDWAHGTVSWDDVEVAFWDWYAA